eukprot:gene14940-43763_t
MAGAGCHPQPSGVLSPQRWGDLPPAGARSCPPRPVGTGGQQVRARVVPRPRAGAECGLRDGEAGVAGQLSLVLLQGDPAQLRAALPKLLGHVHRLGAPPGGALSNLLSSVVGRLAAALQREQQREQQQQPPRDDGEREPKLRALRAEVAELRGRAPASPRAARAKAGSAA